jgi:hypothetical protein
MYTPQIIYQGKVPFLYCNISNIEEGIHPELIGAVERVLEGYSVGSERTQAWLKHAEEINIDWKKRMEDTDLLDLELRISRCG